MLSTEEDPGANVVIAIPVTGGRLCTHFGHCEQFALFEADTVNRQILGSRRADPPPHQPGLLPRWLHDEGANVVIAGGMGRRAQDIFNEQGIRVVVGASGDHPESVVQAYLDGNLNLAENPCDH
jgi:predicted Fe-Mo cluster-binding NifX family protein